MAGLAVGIVVVVVVGVILLTMTLHIVQQYERGVVFRFGSLMPPSRSSRSRTRPLCSPDRL